MGWGERQKATGGDYPWLPPFQFMVDSYEEAEDTIAALRFMAGAVMPADPDLGLRFTTLEQKFEQQLIGQQQAKEKA